MVLVGGGVACIEEASGTGRPSDSRYVLILDLIEEIKATPCDRGSDERTERGNKPNDASQIVSLKKWLC